MEYIVEHKIGRGFPCCGATTEKPESEGDYWFVMEKKPGLIWETFRHDGRESFIQKRRISEDGEPQIFSGDRWKNWDVGVMIIEAGSPQLALVKVHES